MKLQEVIKIFIYFNLICVNFNTIARESKTQFVPEQFWSGSRNYYQVDSLIMKC